MKKTIERDGKTIEISVSYDIGGANYFTGTIEARGYSLHVQPISIEKTASGVEIRTMRAYTGVKKFLLEVKKQSPKQLAKAESMVSDELVENMIRKCKF